MDTVHQLWPNEQLLGELAQILPTPQHFEQASMLVGRGRTAGSGTFGDDPQQHLTAVRACAEAGFDEV
ncbi:hypothetical protein V2S66_30255 [Streptomyces sp. V4-01]|uniref:Uncharacterized protein n=1 Tax=Actinacidiphila polyblastidii TaxID=3110430 RepID=A0ABU7PKI1_9ACTN|nr:hypothetical protein [Streptomyces sp. V4-01]